MLRKINIPFVLVVVAIFLLLFFTLSQHLQEKKMVKISNYLIESTDINHWELVDKGDYLLLSFAPQADICLSKFWPKLKEDLSLLSKKEIELEIIGDFDEELQTVYEAIKFPFYEGLAKGNLVTMKDEIEKIAQKEGLLESVLSIDENYIYLTLKSKEGILYEVIPREQAIFARGERSDLLW